MRILVLPLIVLGMLASYLTALGIAALWHTPFPLEYFVALAQHAAWMLPATRKARGALVATGWIASVWLCSTGIHALYFTDSENLLALVIEAMCLLIAFGIAPPEAWPERLARWRRCRSEVATQLRMGQGIAPWLRACARQGFTGAADLPIGLDYQRFTAALADAEHRMLVRLNRTAMPEQLRQSVQEKITALVGLAEMASAQRAIDLEHQALNAAADFRDQCERLKGITASERQSLAAQCEQLFLELTRH